MNERHLSYPMMLCLLAPMVLALPFAMDIYVPAIPHITTLLHATHTQMQLTLNLFMLVSGFMQMLVGPITDRFGRRRVTLVLAMLFGLGSAMCAATNTFLWLLVGRVIQATGSCGLLAMGSTIARDLYDGNTLARTSSYLNMIIAFSPLFAPFIGSQIDLRWGWRWVFLSLVGLASLILYMTINHLPETLPATYRMKNWHGLTEHYRSLLMDQGFLFYSMAGMFGLTSIFLFCAISPVILMVVLKTPERLYGFYFAFMGLSFFFGSLLCSRLVDHLGIYRTTMIGFMLSLLGGIWMITWIMVTGLSVYNFCVPMLVIGIGGSCSMSSGAAGAVQHFKHISGIASALCTGSRFLFAALAGLAISPFVTSAMPLGLLAMAMSIVGLLVFTLKQEKLLLP